MNALGGQGWTWFGSGDLVHFDFLFRPNLGGDSVLAFQRLWNKNNSGQLVEDGVWGPNTENALASSPTTGFGTYGCAPANGTLNGVVYAVNPADATGPLQVLAGAKVDVSGQQLVSGGDGTFSVSLAPGSYMITASSPATDDAVASKTVQSSQTANVSLGLKVPGMPTPNRPSCGELAGERRGARPAAVTLQGTRATTQGRWRRCRCRSTARRRRTSR